MKLESLVDYLDTYLDVRAHPDYPEAMNGLQVGGPTEIRKVAAAVDASLEVIQNAVRNGTQLLLVHHGLFWGGAAPWTGARLAKIRALVDGNLAVYACHLPLDGHPELGNASLLARSLGLEDLAPFGAYKGASIGCRGVLPDAVPDAAFAERLGGTLGCRVHWIPGGPPRVERVGIVTGSGASFLEEAAAAGLDALVTGEGPHHTHASAMEAGIHVLFGGHYATETFGVRALAEHLSDRFGLESVFLDHPTGL